MHKKIIMLLFLFTLSMNAMEEQTDSGINALIIKFTKVEHYTTLYSQLCPNQIAILNKALLALGFSAVVSAGLVGYGAGEIIRCGNSYGLIKIITGMFGIYLNYSSFCDLSNFITRPHYHSN